MSVVVHLPDVERPRLAFNVTISRRGPRAAKPINQEPFLAAVERTTSIPLDCFVATLR